MVIVDTQLLELERKGTPVRVGLVGAGVMGRMIALQLLTPLTGIRLVAIANRTIDKASQAYTENGAAEVQTVCSVAQLTEAIRQRRAAITDDPVLLCASNEIDVIVESTGTIEFAAHTVMNAIEQKKHIVLVNAELDSTLGPILKHYADKAGVIITNVDGDEPGVAMNLVRYLRSLGFETVGAGNLKGMIDRYRTPATQRAFADQYGQNAAIITSFADGTKLAMEETILANAAGFRVGTRGMYGPKCTHVKEIASLLPAEQLLNGGLVDYALGAEPFSGAFVIVHETHPVKQKHLAYLKMGSGPFYVFYTPYHLPHIQLPSSIARAALFGDATTAPIGDPKTEVITITKKDLVEGEFLDGVGGFCTYGTIENSPVARRENLLPMGLSEGCQVKHKIAKNTPLTFDDVLLPQNRLCDRLWNEQRAIFSF
ncbi:MAG TPA: NAD(P)-dependent oxidoreductase [Bacteroidota bacterium]|nr:NAD(P)-dependent oxidoreductase [Bacteroidota bacterium]